MAWAVRRSGIRSLSRARNLCSNWENATLGIGDEKGRMAAGAARNHYRSNSSNQLVVQPSYNGKRVFLVDTLQLVRKLEKQGLTDNQAEAITAVITEVLNDSLENVAQSFVSKPDMQRKELVQDAVLSKLKGEIISQLELRVSTTQRDAERLRTDLEKLRSELKYEIDKVTSNQRLDFNLERGHLREAVANQNTDNQNLKNRMDSEIHALKTQLEVAKADVIKYCIGSIISVTALGLGLIRILM